MPEFPLLAPAGFSVNDKNDESVQITQRVSMVSEQSSQTLLAAWVVNGKEVSFVGLSPTGQRLLTLSYDGTSFKEDYSDLLTAEIPGRAVMSHVQLAHWPEESIEKELSSSEWKMNFYPEKRSLYYKGRHVMDIVFGYVNDKNTSLFRKRYPKKMQISSRVMALQLNIETLNVNINPTP